MLSAKSLVYAAHTQMTKISNIILSLFTFKVKRSKVNLQGAGHIVEPTAQLVTIKLYIIVNGILAYKSHIFNICLIADTV